MKVIRKEEKEMDGILYNYYHFDELSNIRAIPGIFRTLIESGISLKEIKLEGYGDIGEGNSFQEIFKDYEDFYSNYTNYWSRDIEIVTAKGSMGPMDIQTLINLKQSLLSMSFDKKYRQQLNNKIDNKFK